MRSIGRQGAAALLNLEALGLLYVAIPSALFLQGWIFGPLGPVAAVAVSLGVVFAIFRTTSRADAPSNSAGSWLLVLAVTIVWCVLGGQGHFLFANSDWVVRDAVLLDLVREPWPVRYQVDGLEMVLRAPVGFYLPAATFGKLFGVRAAELFMFAWTACGVVMVLALLLRDRPTWKAACIRIGVFVFFSGMDIIPTVVRGNPYRVGAMIEWWAAFLQYSSTTTLLFWVPNHTMPGWIATAWLLSRDLRTIPIERVILFVVLTPIWSPLTALGIAPLVVALIAYRFWVGGGREVIRAVFDFPVVVTILFCVALIFPYLIAGSDQVPYGFAKDLPWVGEEATARYIEFVVVEFVGIATLLVIHRPRDLLLWVSIAVLLALPVYRFGPYNDLVMRTSIPALAVLAILSGRWLSQPTAVVASPRASSLLILLLAVGAVTPFMEMARPFHVSRWPMNVQASVVDVTRGTHYLTSSQEPWIEHFLRRPKAP